MTSLFKAPRRAAPFVLAAALASTSALALAPTTALAVPAGGYADLVETVVAEALRRSDPARLGADGGGGGDGDD